MPFAGACSPPSGLQQWQVASLPNGQKAQHRAIRNRLSLQLPARFPRQHYPGGPNGRPARLQFPPQNEAAPHQCRRLQIIAKITIFCKNYEGQTVINEKQFDAF